MPTPLSAALCALPVLVLWTLAGAAAGRRLLGEDAPVLALAPALGWALVSAAALPVFLVVGVSTATVAGFAAVVAGAAVLALRGRWPDAGGVPLAALLGAAALALVPAAAVLPKAGVDGVALAAPIFDHSKVTVIDAIARLGLPAVNPVFAEAGGADAVSYYYLWHFSAAMAALLGGGDGWSADAGVSWFTAFASLALMMGLAVWWSGRGRAAYWVLLLAAAASLRPALERMAGAEAVSGVLAPAGGFGGWLFQTSWAPQHVQGAATAVLAALLLARLAQRPGPRTASWRALGLALTVAASFQSSIWIGAVVFPAGAAVAGAVLLWRSAVPWRFAAWSAAAAVGAVLLSLPLLIDQYAAALLRSVDAPVRVAPLAVLGAAIAEPLRPVLDLPAYWLVMLPVLLPTVYPLGLWALPGLAQRPDGAGVAGTGLAAAGLAVAWLLVSTVGENNDLGWRALLPAVLVLTGAAAAWLATPGGRGRGAVRAGAVALALLGLPHGWDIARHNLEGIRRPEADAAFARAPALWQAVRRHAGPADRIANNPLYLEEMTLWPVNIAWALLSDRSSCFAGRELALAFAPLSGARRNAIHDQFVRIFAGTGTTGDLDDLIRRYGCRVAVVTRRDGAWSRDPFAASPRFRLAEAADDWRIYVATPLPGLGAQVLE